MADISPQPNSPDSWKAYATSDAVKKIPLQEFQDVNKRLGLATFRGVYLEASTAIPPSMSNIEVFSDIFALTNEETIISPDEDGTVEITTRVLTADAPVKIVVPPGVSCGIEIYAAIVDQPITVCSGDSNSVTLDLGVESGNVGVVVAFFGDEMVFEYEKEYYRSTSNHLHASLNTQLRIALVQFWKNTSIAISLCAYVAAVTKGQKNFSLLNTQAVGLGQQLAGQVLAGPNMDYAPVLTFQRYIETARAALDAAEGYEREYRRFQEKRESVEDQILIWDAMLSIAENERGMRSNLRTMASNKYTDAVKAATSCVSQFNRDINTLELAKSAFETGLEKWKWRSQLKAAFAILQATIGFAVAIGTLALGNPGGGSGAAGAVGTSVEAVKAAENIRDQTHKFLSSKTFEALGNAVGALGDLIPLVDSIVEAVAAFELDPNVEIPSIEEISGSKIGDADATAIMTMAAWDKWMLEADQQMEFAVDENIEGARAYQLALRKHAINGKQVAQAQAETINTGYEYVQAQMEVIVSQQQIDILKELKNNFEGQEEVHAEAEAMFYDRSLALRTGIVISLRNAALAYRYWALARSSISLDADKSVERYRADLSHVINEKAQADEGYVGGFQPFRRTLRSEELPADFGPSVLEGIKGETHTGSFTLLPENGLESIFDEGSHYRIDRINPTLQGALPNPDAVKDGMVEVSLQISTSGIHADIQKKNGKDEIFYFARPPQSRRCIYQLHLDGTRGETIVDPTFESEDHTEPTPFTQWEIKLVDPKHVINLDGLEGIEIKWEGHVRYDEVHRRSRGEEL